MSAAVLARPRSSGRPTLLLITALLAMPFVIATLLWHFGWQPGRQTNHGELLASASQPPLVLHEAHLQRISGRATLPSLATPSEAPLAASSTSAPFAAPTGPSPAPVPGASGLLGHWLLALAVPAECNAACLEQLHLARQVQVSLNKEMMRLRRALISPQAIDPQVLATLGERWPDLLIARAETPAWATLASPDGMAHLVLIDPQGRLVLRYPARPDAQGVRRDLERLLKYSWLG